MDNLRKRVGELQLDKNWKRKEEKERDRDEHDEEKPLLKVSARRGNSINLRRRITLEIIEFPYLETLSLPYAKLFITQSKVIFNFFLSSCQG